MSIQTWKRQWMANDTQRHKKMGEKEEEGNCNIELKAFRYAIMKI